METKKARTKVVVSLLALAGLLVLSAAIYAGSLEPSALPGPTMKTLDEVEPRIPIHASDLPLTITEPNSYYLAETINFEPNNINAITIEANDVTIDLMGYTLKGPDSGNGCGIYMNGRSNVEVRNGTVRDFGSNGIHEASSSNGKEHRVISVRALSNGWGGIRIFGYGHLVKDCTAAHNTYHGISLSYGCTVTGSTAYSNQNDGINLGHGCTVTGNTAYGNNGYGIGVTQGDNLIDENTAYGNTSGNISSCPSCTFGLNHAP